MRASHLITAAIIAAALTGPAAGPARAQIFTEANGVRMSSSGAAGVNAQTQFRQGAIAAALPGMRITEGAVYQDGEVIPVFLASDRGEVLLRIFGGPDGLVAAAEGISRRVYGPSRIRIGMNFARVPESARAHCVRGEGQWAGAVFCGESEDATLWFVFQPPAGAAPGDGAATPPDALADAELIQMRWSATPGR